MTSDEAVPGDPWDPEAFFTDPIPVDVSVMDPERRQAARNAFCKYAVLTKFAGDGLDAALVAWERWKAETKS